MMDDDEMENFLRRAAGRADEAPKEMSDRYRRVLERLGKGLPQEKRDQITAVLRREAGDLH